MADRHISIDINNGDTIYTPIYAPSGTDSDNIIIDNPTNGESGNLIMMYLHRVEEMTTPTFYFGDSFVGTGTSLSGPSADGYCTILWFADVNGNYVLLNTSAYESIVPMGTEVFAWVTTSSVNIARASHAGVGSTYAALTFGGVSDITSEKFDGTSWATTASLNKDYTLELGGYGNTSAAHRVGGYASGYYYAWHELWNGSTWSTLGGLLRQICGAGCFGDVSSAIMTGGHNPGTLYITDKWSGSAWATTTSLNQARYDASAAGSGSSNGIISSGHTSTSGALGAITNTTEVWDGSIWATTTAMNSPRDKCGSSNTGDSTGTISFGGISNALSTKCFGSTEIWSGTAWATAPTLNAIRYYMGSCGSSTLALCIAGITSSTLVATCEKWSGKYNELT